MQLAEALQGGTSAEAPHIRYLVITPIGCTGRLRGGLTLTLTLIPALSPSRFLPLLLTLLLTPLLILLLTLILTLLLTLASARRARGGRARATAIRRIVSSGRLGIALWARSTPSNAWSRYK